MLKIENTNFREKFTEINIRQRMYENNNYLTLMITTDFYPALVNDFVVSGTIEIKLDVENISSLNDLVGKNYKGDIGSVVISVNNDGVWEHQNYNNFEITIDKKNGRELDFCLKTDNCELKTTGILVSLYTTSSSLEDLKNNFDLTDFYNNPTIKEIGNKQVMKFFVKE